MLRASPLCSEIAGKIALSPQRPRRPIAFAAFDCEEQFAMGSFAFTCSERFDQKKIVAVVNVDMLGRDFLGVVPKSVFLVGTESYPSLREHIISESGKDGIKILPIGTALVGPTGDHIPFETMNIPVLFFSCGYFPDYHKPTDTPEKLNYEDIKHSAEIVADTVDYLAGGDQIEKSRAAAPVQKYELETLDYILTTANANQDRLKSSPKQAEMLKKLTQQACQFPVRDNFSRNECLGLMTNMITPALELGGPDFKLDANTLTCVRAMYASHRIFLIEHLRDFFRAGLKNKPSVFGKTKYEYEGYDLTDDLISFTQTPDGGYAIYALLPKIGLTFEIAGLPFPHSDFGLSYSPEPLHCIGQREQITDYCLLIWRRDINDQSLSRSCQKLLSVVTATDANLTYDQWLQWRLAEGPWADEQDWISALVNSDNSTLAAQAKRIEMQIAVQNGRFGKLLPLVDNLSDEKPCPKQYTCEKFQENAGPFAEHPCFLHTCRDANNSFKNLPCPTPADSALERLRTLTGQKFGKDKNIWRRWIETHNKETAVSSARKDDLKS